MKGLYNLKKIGLADSTKWSDTIRLSLFSKLFTGTKPIWSNIDVHKTVAGGPHSADSTNPILLILSIKSYQTVSKSLLK